MNFLCDKCKQKYHVADDKLVGRAVTRFRCKKCDHIIELRAPTPSTTPRTSSSAPPSAAATGSTPSVTRPATVQMPAAKAPAPTPTSTAAGSSKLRPQTTSGPTFGALGFGGAVAPASKPVTPRVTAPGPARGTPVSNAAPGDTGWYAGIRDVPVGPLTRKELATRVASGDVLPDTLVWREGLEDWRPLHTVAELSDLLRSAGEAPRPGAAVPARAERRTSVVDDDEEATRVSGLDPSLAGIMSRSAKSADKSASRASAATPNPATRTADPVRSNATPSSPLGKPSATALRAPSGAHREADKPAEALTSATPKAPERAAVAAAPTTPEHTPTSKSPSDDKPAEVSMRETPSFHEAGDDDQTMLTSSPFERPGAQDVAMPTGKVEPPTQRESSPKVETVNVEASPTQELAPAKTDDDLLEDLFAKPVSASPRSAVTTTPLFSAEPSVSKPTGIAAIDALPAAPKLEAPPPPSLLAAPALPEPKLPDAAAAVPSATTRKPSEPLRGLSASVWLFMGGILFAGILGGIFIGQMNNTPPPDPTPPPTPRPRPVVTTSDVAPSRPPTPPLPSAATPDVTQFDARDAATATSLRGEAIVLALRNSRIVDTCWQQHLRQNPRPRAARVAVDVSVDTQGHATTITVSDSPDARFERCVRDHIDAFGTVGPGDAMDARTSFELDVSN